MSILIKGMKMPVTCCHCPLMGYDPDIEWDDGGIETHGAYICVLTGELIDNTKREEHCPLILVPKHGRLIDADALKKQGYFFPCAIGTEYAIPLRAVREAPTIIPAEEGE